MRAPAPFLTDDRSGTAWAVWRVKYGQTLSYKKRILIFVYGIITSVARLPSCR